MDEFIVTINEGAGTATASFAGSLAIPSTGTNHLPWGSQGTTQNWWSWQSAYDAQYNPAPPAWCKPPGADCVVGHSATPTPKLYDLGYTDPLPYPYFLSYRLSNVTWTSPGTGSITIDGQAWEPSAAPGRNDNWRLFVNGVEYAERMLIVGVNRDTPAAIFGNNLLNGKSLNNIAVSQGDVVKFEIESSFPHEYGSTPCVELQIDFASGPATPGDANCDGIVDQADYTIWYNNYGAAGAVWGQGDFTGEGLVDQADYTVWYNNYGSTGGNVPEPMTMALLAIGGLAMLRRRK